VTGFNISGNAVNMAMSTVSGCVGIEIVDSGTGAVWGNVVTGNGTSNSVAIQLVGKSTSTLTAGITVEGNTGTAWNYGVQEVNNNSGGGFPAASDPDYNSITGNVLHGCTIATAALGPHTLCQLPVPDVGGVPATEQFTWLNSPYTLTSTTSAQKLFNTGTSGGGTLTVPAGVTFFFECEFDLTALSSTSGTFAFGFGGTATYSVKYFASAQKSATAATLAAWSSLVSTSTSPTVLVAASTTTTGAAMIRGNLNIGAAGTIIPQITLSVAAAAVVSASSWFRIWPAGGGATYAGNWS
jgi:hypothetical protein